MNEKRRPGFLTSLSDAYNHKRKNIALLTGDVYGLFACGDRFLSLEQVLQSELGEKFHLVRMDMANCIRFYNEKTEGEVTRICEAKEDADAAAPAMSALKRCIESNRHSPLPSLTLLEGMARKMARHERVYQNDQSKPLCIVFQHAGALFPKGDFDRLSELDRQRLVFFLDWVSDPLFVDGTVLIVMVNPVKSEVNDKITALPNAIHIELDLPGEEERLFFVRHFTTDQEIKFEAGPEGFAKDTAGLTIGNIKDILESAQSTGQTVSRSAVAQEVNRILQASLGDIIKFSKPEHNTADVIGYEKTKTILREVFEQCEDPVTAVPAILVSGPNGVGKTFVLEALAKESGRVVIELANVRGSYFGETDRFFELLRWHIANFGKILILVDEAHTAFGSVHKPDTHETEKRLAGNIIKMMGNPSYFGKVLWGLMTSRPDELDPDVKSRASEQIPIFDLEGQEREQFVAELFRRKKMPLEGEALRQLLAATEHYSARDFSRFVVKVLAKRRKNPAITIVEVLQKWQATKAIMLKREFQMLVAAQHCSYPELLPERLKNMDDTAIASKIYALSSLI